MATRNVQIFIDILFNIFSTRICFGEENAIDQSISITFTYSVILQDNLEWPFSNEANLENIMILLEHVNNIIE